MTEAIAIPAEYAELFQQEDSFQSFDASIPIPSQYIEAGRDGWRPTKTSPSAAEARECECDVQDSLKALEEGPGVSLEAFRAELDG